MTSFAHARARSAIYSSASSVLFALFERSAACSISASAATINSAVCSFIAMGREAPSIRRPALHKRVFANASRKPWRDEDYSAAKGAYDGRVPEGYELDRSTKTLKFYRRKNDPSKVLLGVRGTADVRDVFANAHLAVGALKHSKRYKADKEEVAAYLRAHPDAKIETASHSLGGAVARGLARDFGSSITGGAAFNSAIGLDELLKRRKLTNVKQTRVSTQRDFLRLLANPFLSKPADVVIPGRPTVIGSHALSNFDSTSSNARP